MAALAGEMPGSIPDPEAVTASGGICESLTWSNASICFCRVWMSLTSTGLVGPRLDAEEYSPSQPGSVLTAGFVAEDGRDWKYCGSGLPLASTNSWHSRLEPITRWWKLTSDPLAGPLNATWD